MANPLTTTIVRPEVRHGKTHEQTNGLFEPCLEKDEAQVERLNARVRRPSNQQRELRRVDQSQRALGQGFRNWPRHRTSTCRNHHISGFQLAPFWSATRR